MTHSGKKIYIVCPAYVATGGPELAHQLVWVYQQKGYDATMAYVDPAKYKDPINPAYKKYISDWCAIEDVEDTPDNIIIWAEIYTEYIPNYRHACNVIWWMSVDNYENRLSFGLTKQSVGFLRAVKHWLFFPKAKKLAKRKIQGARAASMHLYQSEYAREYLEKQGFENIVPLSDFINDSYFEPYEECPRENIVLYNPRKGFKFTKKIIARAPELHWIPIQNMSASEIAALLRKSKVYIDFGNHPGKDRFPREAAISGCCIITGQRGAARNDVDIPIDPQYKFSDQESEIDGIIGKIKECFDDFERRQEDFASYREKIMGEKAAFFEEAVKVAERLLAMN